MTVPHTSALISLEVNMLSNMQRKCESPNPAASRVRGPESKVPRRGGVGQRHGRHPSQGGCAGSAEGAGPQVTRRCCRGIPAAAVARRPCPCVRACAVPSRPARPAPIGDQSEPAGPGMAARQDAPHGCRARLTCASARAPRQDAEGGRWQWRGAGTPP